MPGSLFLSSRIIPGLHIPASRAPQGKELGNSKSPEQLGSLFTVLAACVATLPVCLKHLGNTQSLQKLELGAREQKWIKNKFSLKVRTGTFTLLSNFPAIQPHLYQKTQCSARMCWEEGEHRLLPSPPGHAGSNSLSNDQLLKYIQLCSFHKTMMVFIPLALVHMSLYWNTHTFLLSRLTPACPSRLSCAVLLGSLS